MSHRLQKTSGLNAALLAAALAGEARAVENGSYLVLESAGRVFAWQGLDVGWYPLEKGDTIRFGTLLQSPGDARVVLQTDGLEVPEQVVLDFPVPLMFRAAPETRRKLMLANYYVRRMGDIEIKKAKTKDYLHIRDAWERVASLFSAKSNSEARDRMRATSGKGVGAGMTAEPKVIELTYPARGGVLVPESFPVKVPVVWEPVKGYDGLYEVRIARPTDSGAQQTFKTRELSVEMNLSVAGAYTVQVMTSDGTWQSTEQPFNVYGAGDEVWRRQPPKPVEPKVHQDKTKPGKPTKIRTK